MLLSEKTKKINEAIISKLRNANKKNLPALEKDIYNLYKNHNNKVQKDELLKTLKNKDINRTVTKEHNTTKQSSYGRYFGNIGRSMVNSAKTFSKTTGLSYLGKKISEKTGISVKMPTGTKEKLKELKGDIQILRKEINKEKNQEKIKKITNQINLKKRRIKEITGINYNETLETYENVMSKNESRFDLDGEYNKLLIKRELLKRINQNNQTNQTAKNNQNNQITLYRNLLTQNKNKGKSIRITPELYDKIFVRDNTLFKKFSLSVPYSEYNFLYGIDKLSSLSEERLVALLYMTQIIFAFAIEPHIVVATTVIVISLLLSRFAFDYYRKYKRTMKKNLVFCVKYFPFNGLEHFSSELIAKYHKIFYYNIDQSNTNTQNTKFYESIIELSEDEEKEFIERNILFIDYLNQYEEEMNRNIETTLKSSASPETLKEVATELQKNIGEQNKEVQTVINEENNGSERTISEIVEKNRNNGKIPQSESLLSVKESINGNGNNISLSEIQLIPKNVINGNRQNSENNSSLPEEEFISQQQVITRVNKQNLGNMRIAQEIIKPLRGGKNMKALKNNTNKMVENKDRNPILKAAKKKVVNKKITEQFSEINRAIFRLNFRITGNDKTYLLTSGDISIQYLFVELKPIINARATFFEGELKPLSKSIPFFTNDYLTNLLDFIASESTKYGTMESTRLFIIDFIKEYIDNFIKLYIILYTSPSRLNTVKQTKR